MSSSEPEKQTWSEIPEFPASYFIKILTQLMIRFVGYTESRLRVIVLKSVSPLRSVQGIPDSGINNSLAQNGGRRKPGSGIPLKSRGRIHYRGNTLHVKNDRIPLLKF